MLIRALGLLLTCCVTAMSPGAEATSSSLSSITTSASRVFASESYVPAIVGIAVINAATGEVLFESNSRKSLLPASCMKVITTAAAMHYLGPGYQFTTSLNVCGQVNAGILEGDLLVIGSGDPTFGSTRVPESLTSTTILQTCCDAVRRAGIHTVRGTVRVDTSCFRGDPIPPTWEWEDIGNYYGAGVSGLNFRDNFFDLILHPGRDIGDAVQIAGTEPPNAVDVEWINDLVTSAPDTGDQAYVYSAPHSNKYWVSGTIPVGGELRAKATLHDPSALFARLLAQNLGNSGIHIENVSPAARATETSSIATVLSPPLSKIVRVIHKQSFNLYAEALLMQIGRVVGDGSRESAIASERQYLAQLGVPLDGVQIADGCGLSRGDAITPLMMATLLYKIQREPWFGTWRDSLALMGVDGDLRDRAKDTPLAGKVRAKTGLITRVRGLSGYLETGSGRKLTFAIHVNHYQNAWRDVDNDIDQFLEALARHL